MRTIVQPWFRPAMALTGIGLLAFAATAARIPTPLTPMAIVRQEVTKPQETPILPSAPSGPIRGLFVVEYSKFDVQIYGTDSRVRTFTPAVNSPSGIVFDRAGHLFIADSGHNQIQEFDAHGVFVKVFARGICGNPWGLALDSQENLFVVDASAGLLHEFDPEGQPIRTFGSNIHSPYGIAINAQNHMFVADAFGPNIQEYDDEGDYVKTFGVGLKHPTGLAVDTHGHLFVADYGDPNTEHDNGACVQEYDSEGNRLRTFGQNLIRPYGITVDPAGRIIVSDARQNILQEYLPDGTLLQTFRSEDLIGPTFLAISPPSVVLASKAFSLSRHLLLAHRASMPQRLARKEPIQHTGKP